jgi:hypothetical protein
MPMLSASRFSFLPAIVAGSAAAGGILGAFVAVGLVATPPAPQSDSKAAPPPAKQAALPQPEEAPPLVPRAEAAETNGSAAAGQAAAADCDNETWPYLSRPCMEEWQRKNRNVRVISTDKLDRPRVDAIEHPRSSAADGGNAPAPAIAQEPSLSHAPLPAAVSAPWFNPATPGAPIIPSASSQPWSAAAGSSVEQASKNDGQVKTAAKPDAKSAKDDEAKSEARENTKRKSKHAASKARRNTKAANVETEDDQDAAVVARGNDDEDAAPAEPRRQHRQARRRDRDDHDDAVAADDESQRPVVVYRRGGLFGGLFGFDRPGPDGYYRD